MFRSWLREPLLHFLAIGALLFAIFGWQGGTGSNRIVVTPGEVESMVATFSRTWQRQPTEQELKNLLDDRIRDEMAVREAVALGLDRDDTVIRRRLRQKLEFIVEGDVDATPVTDAELQTYLDRHPDRYRLEPILTLRQVYLSPQRRGAALDADGQALLARLTLAGASAEIGNAGDPLLMPAELPGASRSDIARQFGDVFADATAKLQVGKWTGPIPSGFGVHVVFVRERVDSRAPRLDEVRADVERDLRADRQRERLDALYVDLLSRYRITIEGASGARSNNSAATPAGTAK